MLRVGNDVPIDNGSFEVNALDNVIQGTFESATMASGTFSADLEASPVMPVATAVGVAAP